jgi:hypothetical protein
MTKGEKKEEVNNWVERQKRNEGGGGGKGRKEVIEV